MRCNFFSEFINELSARILMMLFFVAHWTGKDGNVGKSSDAKLVSNYLSVRVSIIKKPELSARVEKKQSSLEVQNNDTNIGLESLCQYYDSDEEDWYVILSVWAHSTFINFNVYTI